MPVSGDDADNDGDGSSFDKGGLCTQVMTTLVTVTIMMVLIWGFVPMSGDNADGDGDGDDNDDGFDDEDGECSLSPWSLMSFQLPIWMHTYLRS